MNNRNKKRGITLIEVVVYTALLAFLTVLVIRASLSMYDTYVYVKVLSDINNSATLSMERMGREIRDAESIDVGLSTFESNPGVLVINTTNGESSESVSFFIDASSRLVIQREGEEPSPLTESQLEISNLVFRHIITDHSEAVKIELSVQNTVKGEVIERNYYNTIILKGSY